MSDFAVVIPARFASVRLPGKPLRDILGKPMIQHVYERAIASAAMEVVVATDDSRIADAAESFGATVCMTGTQHNSGSERIAEVCDIMDWPDDRIVVNLQGDEPTMPPELIDQCAALLDDPSADIGTLASPIASKEDLQNPNVVKAVADANGYAIYFRRVLMSPGDAAHALHHHGIYAYRCGVLRRLVAAPPCAIELSERLEQLRALDLGMTIRIAVPVVRPGAGVDTEEDLAVAAKSLKRSD